MKSILSNFGGKQWFGQVIIIESKDLKEKLEALGQVGCEQREMVLLGGDDVRQGLFFLSSLLFM